VIWLVLAGGVVLRVFMWWELHRLARGQAALVDGLRSSLSLLAIIALIALFATRRIPTQQPTASPAGEPSE